MVPSSWTLLAWIGLVSLLSPTTTSAEPTTAFVLSSSPSRKQAATTRRWFSQKAPEKPVMIQEDAVSSSSSTLLEPETVKSTASSFKGFDKKNKNNEKKKDDATAAEDSMGIPMEDAKDELVQLLSSMTGKAHEFRRVETLINALEAQYQPVQTLDFFNLLQRGQWQLLFSTSLANSASATSPQVFRMRELVQTVKPQPSGAAGQWNTTVAWELADQMPGQFHCAGTFTVRCNYTLVAGTTRQQLQLQEHLLQPKSQALPQDFQALVGMLYRAMPKPIFDPAHHAIDTTYMDATLKIVRYTGGPHYEGVRDVWIRLGALQMEEDDDEVDAKTTTGMMNQPPTLHDDGSDDNEDELF